MNQSYLKVTIRVGGIKEVAYANKVSFSEDYAILTRGGSTTYFKYYDLVSIEVYNG